MTEIYYYVLDVAIDGYIGCGVYMGTVTRTLPIAESIVLKGLKNNTRDTFTEKYFNENREKLIAEAIADYNNSHKQHVNRIVGLRRTPILELNKVEDVK